MRERLKRHPAAITEGKIQGKTATCETRNRRVFMATKPRVRARNIAEDATAKPARPYLKKYTEKADFF
ncbi:MAG: hypothetical protein RR356_02260 [Bacteroidales bacterium]